MKKLLVLVIAITAMACQQNKIAFVDSVRIMDEYQEKVDVEARFKTKADAMGKKRDSISQAFQLELQQFQTKAQKMSQKNAQEEYAQLQQRGQFVGQQLQQEEQQLQQSSQAEMDSLANVFQRSRGLIRGEVKTLFSLFSFSLFSFSLFSFSSFL